MFGLFHFNDILTIKKLAPNFSLALNIDIPVTSSVSLKNDLIRAYFLDDCQNLFFQVCLHEIEGSLIIFRYHLLATLFFIIFT